MFKILNRLCNRLAYLLFPSLGRDAWPAEITDDEVIQALRTLPRHSAGLSTLTGSVSTNFGWQAQNNLTGGTYNPITNTGTLRKNYSVGTAAANNLAGGADEIFSFQQSISAGSTATLDLTTMTNILAQASVSIARLKAMQIRVLSATDDSTISPAPTATSTGTVTNNGPAVPNPLDFSTGGSGLTLTIGVSSTIINSVAIGAAGTLYPPSAKFIVSPNQAGGSGALISVTTNASGVPTSVAIVTGGTGYTAGTVPSTDIGQYTIYTGGAHMYFDVKPTGFALVSATSKNVLFINNDSGHAITFEIDFFAGTT